MLNIDEIQNGIVIDHIKAGTAVGLMELLGITGNKTANVALIQNARSHKADCGRKTGTGKLMRAKAFKSHILSKKSTKRKRGFRQETEIAAADRKVIKSRLA